MLHGILMGKFERDNVSKFLRDYKAHMRFLGKETPQQLIGSLLVFVEEEVLEALEVEAAYQAQADWAAVKAFLVEHYKRYDGVVTRQGVEAELRKKEYRDLDGYLRNFERLVWKLKNEEIPRDGEKVLMFL